MFALPRKRAPAHRLGAGLAAFTAPDTCREGFVWREIVPTGQAGVTPAHH